MPGFFPLSTCALQAGERRTALAASVVKMFKSSLVPTESTTVAELDAAEADFDGYAAVTLTTWGAPILGPVSGYAIYSPGFQFSSGAPNTTQNDIGGLYLVDSGGALRAITTFEQPLPMGAVGQGYVDRLVEYFPTQFAG